MKRRVLSWGVTLVLIFLGFSLQALAQAKNNKNVLATGDNCFEVEYLGAKSDGNGLVAVRFDVKSNCDSNIEVVSFELPANAGVISPIGFYQAKNKKYKVEAAIKKPFHSVRFLAVGGKKANSKHKAKQEVFEYVLSEVEFARMSQLTVAVRSAAKKGTVTFNLSNSAASGSGMAPLATCSAPMPVISGNADLCPGEIVKFAIKENKIYRNIVWQIPEVGSDGLPSNWEIISGQNTNVLEVRVGDVSGTVFASVDVADCGTKIVSKATYIGDEIPVTISVVNGTQSGKEEFRPGDVMVFNANANQNRDKREYNYEWSIPVGWSLVSGQGTNQLIVVAGNDEGFIELNVSSKSDRTLRYCGLGYAYVELVKEGSSSCEKPDFDVDAPAEVCTNNGQVYRFAVRNPDPAGKMKYEFFFPDEFQEVGRGYGYVDIKVVNAKPDSTLYVTIVAVNSNNCGAEAVCIPVEVKECPSTCDKPEVALVAPDTICNLSDEPTTIRVAQMQEGVTYTFTIPENFIIMEEGPGFVKVVAAFEEDQLGQPVTFRVTATNECGTSNAEASSVVTECEPANPLPVSLTSFTGVSRTGVIELAWSTASEVNNDRFEIERSLNGKTFAKIGEVKGMGNSSAVVNYSFTDRSASNGTVYYRLKQVDHDGAFEYSKVIAVSHSASASSKSAMSVYPNPVTDGRFIIQFAEAVKEGASLRLVDMNGKVLHVTEVGAATSEAAMDIAKLNLKAGVYLITVTSDGKSATQRIMIR